MAVQLRHALRVGVATVTGAGSKWTNTGDFVVGVDGHGTLNIAAGGLVSNVNGILGQMSGSGGAVNVSGAGSQWANSGDLVVGDDGAGTLTVTSGGVVVAGTVNVGSLGEVHGDGTITGNVQSGGLVSPGNSPGALHITGNYTQTSAGKLLIELAGTTSGSQYDELLVTGDITFGGSLEVLLAGFSPALGDSFDILDGASLNGTFSTVVLPTLAAGLSWNRSQLYVTGGLSVSALTADFDEDGDVDATDLALWKVGFGVNSGATHEQGDADGDLDVDGADFLAWQRQLGAPSTRAFAAVPELATLPLLILTASAAVCGVMQLRRSAQQLVSA